MLSRGQVSEPPCTIGSEDQTQAIMSTHQDLLPTKPTPQRLLSILTKTHGTAPMMDFRDVGQGVPGSPHLLLTPVWPLRTVPSLPMIAIVETTNMLG